MHGIIEDEEMEEEGSDGDVEPDADGDQWNFYN